MIIVRTQDKTGLIECNMIYVSETSLYQDVWRVMSCRWDDYDTLGHYETQEQCLKVLDKIHAHLNRFQTAVVFEMPQNHEVKV
jgi:hypothetical protein